MENKKTSIILKEYYQIVSPMLVFAPCGDTDQVSRRVLEMLCDMQSCKAEKEECWAMIEEAKCLRSCADGALLSTELSPKSIAYDIKMGVLAVCKVIRVRQFDAPIFVEELREEADAGNKNACKLLAFLNWLGIWMPVNRETAINIWSMLTVSGDRTALEMLIYAYGQLERTEELKKYRNIRDILQKEYASFSAIALYSNYPMYSEEEVQMANMILYISRQSIAKGTATMDRPMLYYALRSEDDYQTKMQMLSGETNYFLAMHNEDGLSRKRIGF